MWVNGYVGLPWLRLGRTRAGLDCWGLARLVLGEQRGIWLPLYDTVDPDDGNAVASAIAAGKATWVSVAEAEAREFDFVVMRSVFEAGGRLVSKPVHVGLVAPRRHILHIHEGGTSVLQPFNALRHRVVEILRHKELA